MNPSLSQHGNFAKQHNKQSGVALIIFFLVLILAGSAVLFSVLDSNSIKIERDKKTAAALAEAKTALIGRAVMDASMPGSLPCPSTSVTYDGIVDFFIGNACPSYIGWFPWKTLNTGDLRDGYSERLWYVLSPAYRDDSSVQPLNSDTAGTLSVDGRGDIVAIIFAPGPPISQSRPSNNVLDYLEGENSNGDTAYSTALSTIKNDRLITISRDEIMRVVEKRVAGEVLSCLKQYALLNSGGLNRHPWTTDLATGTYSDTTNKHFGHIPDTPAATPFDDTRADSGNNMSNVWPAAPACNIISGAGWWLNWKELVFYVVAYDKDPNNIPSPACDDSPANDCLTMITPSGTQNYKKAAVIVAGKALTGQTRSTALQKQTLSNYLEGENISAVSAANPDGEDTKFEQKPATAIFNDVVVFY